MIVQGSVLYKGLQKRQNKGQQEHIFTEIKDTPPLFVKPKTSYLGRSRRVTFRRTFFIFWILHFSLQEKTCKIIKTNFCRSLLISQRENNKYVYVPLNFLAYFLLKPSYLVKNRAFGDFEQNKGHLCAL